MSEPIKVTDAEFEAKVINSKLPTIVDFWAPWCGPCRAVAPILDKMAGEYDGRMIIAKVNTDEDNQWAGKYDIRGIPTMLFFNNGVIVHRQVGALPEPHLRDLFEQFIEVATQPAN